MVEDQIEVLYNGCYGGWEISNEAYELYNLKMLEKDPTYQPYVKKGDYYYQETYKEIERNDPILLQIFHEIGIKMNVKYSKICVETFPKKYEKYYWISEYDGLESVVINKVAYEYDTLKSTLKEILVDDTISSDDKISKFMKMINVDKIENH